jgi:excisionase family DNA binding protein
MTEGPVLESAPVADVEPLLTVAEVAAMLRVSKMTIYRLVHAGDLAAFRVSRTFRIPLTAALTLRQSQPALVRPGVLRVLTGE